MRFLYNVLAVILVIAAIPVFILRTLRENGFIERLRQSCGCIPQDTLVKVANKDCLWLHAASVGEIVAASPIVKELKRQFPDIPILISVVTTAGYAMAGRIIQDADGIIFFPLDLPYLSQNVVRRIRPQVFMMVETELWPNFLQAIHRLKIPVMMVNGRISDKSASRYSYLGGILQDMLNTVQLFCMQSALDAKYITDLGADPQRVVVTGNTKFDQTYAHITEQEREQLAQDLGLADCHPIIIAGSTHKGEEEHILKAFCQVRASFPQAKLILAPRDIKRADELKNMARTFNLTALQRTAITQNSQQEAAVLLLDTIGELGKVYSIGDIIFVGGSLIAQGGHNVLEPAAHGKPIIVGPHMFNFKDSYVLLRERGACVTVEEGSQLGDKLLAILHDNNLREQMGSEARKIIEENGGAARKSVEQLKRLWQYKTVN